MTHSRISIWLSASENQPLIYCSSSSDTSSLVEKAESFIQIGSHLRMSQFPCLISSKYYLVLLVRDIHYHQVYSRLRLIE